MILYHPYKDANHCAYRIISLMWGLKQEVLRNFINIADFYYLFPSELKKIKKWPRKNSKNYKLVQSIEGSHEVVSNSRIVFHEMKEVRNNTFLNLISRGVICEVTPGSHTYNLERSLIPESLVETLENDEYRKTDIYKLIIEGLSLIPLNGPNGLKDRTDLLEYRYDD